MEKKVLETIYYHVNMYMIIKKLNNVELAIKIVRVILNTPTSKIFL